MPSTKKFNPAAYKPTTKVLRMVVRGRAGTRKTTFAASIAEAGLGPILFLDTERKVTNVRNWQTRFAETLTLTDAEAVEGAVDWLISDPDARDLNLAGVVVDSWNGYFQLKLDEALKARIAETGAPTATLTGEQRQRLTVECGANVLHPLCVKFGGCVVITDVKDADGQHAERAANEFGEIVPLTLSGTEYAVDLIVEAQLLPEQDGIGEYVLHRIVKSNIEALPIGCTLKNPTFKDYLDRVGAADIATAASLRAEAQARETLEAGPPLSVVPPAEPTTADLVAGLIRTTEERGFTVAQLRSAVVRSYGKPDLTFLTREEIAELEQRIRAATPETKGAGRGAAPPPATTSAARGKEQGA